MWVGVIPGCMGQARWEGVSSRSLNLHIAINHYFQVEYV